MVEGWSWIREEVKEVESSSSKEARKNLRGDNTILTEEKMNDKTGERVSERENKRERWEGRGWDGDGEAGQCSGNLDHEA